MIKGLSNKIKDVEIVGESQHLSPKIVGKISWSPVPGLVFIHVPGKFKDEYMTVLKVSLEGKLKLYRGQGGLK